jgi:tRNA-splicing endonuclease subunit Sen54
MHNALTFPRLHHPKNRVIGFYAPDGSAPPASAFKAATAGENAEDTSASKGDKTQTANLPIKASTTGTGVPADACVYVPNPKGPFFRTMGRADRWNRVWLLPEEALYLLERGSLDIRWPSSITGSAAGDQDDEEDDELSIPMSLQAAYACFIGRGGLTLERFSVYSGLRRLGYAVVRAPSWDESKDAHEEEFEQTTNIQGIRGPGIIGFLGRLFRSILNFNSTGTAVVGPLAGLGIHRSYREFMSHITDMIK